MGRLISLRISDLSHFSQRSDLCLNMPRQFGLPGYLEEDLRRVQDRCLDIIGIPRDTVEPLAIRRKNLTRKEFNCILESESHPRRRFITMDHTYNLRSNSIPFSKFTAPAFYINKPGLCFLENLKL